MALAVLFHSTAVSSNSFSAPLRVDAAYTQTRVLVKGRGRRILLGLWFLTFVLVPQPVLTTSTHEIAWPQGDQFPGGGLRSKAISPATKWLSLPFDTPECELGLTD